MKCTSHSTHHPPYLVYDRKIPRRICMVAHQLHHVSVVVVVKMMMFPVECNNSVYFRVHILPP